MGDTMYLLYNTMYPLRIRLQSRYVEIQYILYPLYLDQIQWIRSVSALGPDTVDTRIRIAHVGSGVSRGAGTHREFPGWGRPEPGEFPRVGIKFKYVMHKFDM